VDEGKDVILLEKNPGRHRYANERLDCRVLLASGTDIEALKSVANLNDADFFVAVTDSDEVNLASGYIVGAQVPKLIKIIRIRNLEYKSIPMIEESVAGPCFVVHPPQETAAAIVKTIEHGAVGDVHEFADGEIQLRSFVLQGQERKIVGKSVQELRNDTSVSFLIPLLRRGGVLQIPGAQTVLQAKDTIYIESEQNHIGQIIEQFDLKGRDASKRVVILGGGDIAITLGRLLSTGSPTSEKGLLHNWVSGLAKWFRKAVHLQRYQIKYIERDHERCKLIMSRLPEVEILKADVSEENLLEEENLTTAHIFIAATDNQELNVVTALYAKNTGIRRAIVLVRTRQMHNIASSLGLDVIVSTSNTMVNSIMRHIHGKNVYNIQSLGDGDMESLELQVGPNSGLVNQPLNETRLRDENAIVTYICRKENIILPTGTTVLHEGDRVILIIDKELRDRIFRLFDCHYELPGKKKKTEQK
ncbi:MAG: NAD-binding protein, partial [Spirochaetota bacterium]